MIREILHIVPFKNFAEQALNCWLTYSMSQPVQFDLTIIALFALQYFGISQLMAILKSVDFNTRAAKGKSAQVYRQSVESSASETNVMSYS